MRSRFKDVPDYFKTIEKVTVAARAFVERAGDKGGYGFRGGATRILPAANAAEWDELLHAETVYLVATDTFRVHIAPAPASLVEGVPAVTPQDGLGEVLAAAFSADGRRIALDAGNLRQAIHPRATSVVLHVPDDERGQPVIVASFIDKAQIALALVMALKRCTPIHSCVEARPPDAGEAAG